MGSQNRKPGARHPRSPLPRTQTVREKLKNVHRKPAPAIPSSRSPAGGGGGGAAPAARTRRMFPFTRGAWNVQ